MTDNKRDWVEEVDAGKNYPDVVERLRELVRLADAALSPKMCPDDCTCEYSVGRTAYQQKRQERNDG